MKHLSPRTSWVLAAIGVLAVAAGFLMVLRFHAARDFAEERDRVRAAILTDKAELVAMQGRRDATEKKMAELTAERDRLAARGGAGAARRPAANPAPPPRAQSLSITEIIRDDPAAQAVYLQSGRAALRATYGPLFRQLNLSADQQRAFQDNLMALREKTMDLDYLSREEGADLAAIGKLRQAASAEYQAAQAALLGAEGGDRLRDYERTSPLRRMVSAIAGAAAVEGAPISAAQADHVVQVLAQASPNFQRGGTALLNDVDWPVVEPAIRRLLSPGQFEVFRFADPGPSVGGFAQTMLYAAINRANAADRAAAANTPPGKP